MTFFLLFLLHLKAIFLLYCFSLPKIINKILRFVCLSENKTWENLAVQSSDQTYSTEWPSWEQVLVSRRNANKALLRMENQNGLSVKAAAHESKWEIRCGNAKPLFSSWPKEVTLTQQNTSMCVQGWSVQERAFGCYKLPPCNFFWFSERWRAGSWLASSWEEL